MRRLVSPLLCFVCLLVVIGVASVFAYARTDSSSALHDWLPNIGIDAFSTALTITMVAAVVDAHQRRRTAQLRAAAARRIKGPVMDCVLLMTHTYKAAADDRKLRPDTVVQLIHLWAEVLKNTDLADQSPVLGASWPVYISSSTARIESEITSTLDRFGPYVDAVFIND